MLRQREKTERGIGPRHATELFLIIIPSLPPLYCDVRVYVRCTEDELPDWSGESEEEEEEEEERAQRMQMDEMG